MDGWFVFCLPKHDCNLYASHYADLLYPLFTIALSRMNFCIHIPQLKSCSIVNYCRLENCGAWQLAGCYWTNKWGLDDCLLQNPAWIWGWTMSYVALDLMTSMDFQLGGVTIKLHLLKMILVRWACVATNRMYPPSWPDMISY